MGDDGLAVTDRLAVIDNVGKLPARRRGRIENMLMHESKADETQKSENLQPIAVVVGHAEERRVRVKSDHDRHILGSMPDHISNIRACAPEA